MYTTVNVQPGFDSLQVDMYAGKLLGELSDLRFSEVVILPTRLTS